MYQPASTAGGGGGCGLGGGSGGSGGGRGSGGGGGGGGGGSGGGLGGGLNRHAVEMFAPVAPDVLAPAGHAMHSVGWLAL
jgi:hypothetical protein